MTIRYECDVEEDWLKLRQQYITATEVGSLLGLNPYSSPKKMWKQKQCPEDLSDNLYIRIGRCLEPAVVEAVNAILNESFTLEQGKVFYGNDAMKIGATPDAYTEELLLECKTCSPHKFTTYRVTPPFNYLVQVAVQMMVTQLEQAYLAIMNTNLYADIENKKLPIVIYKVVRNENLEALIKQEVSRFLENPDTFRVNSKVKEQAILECVKMYTFIHYG